MQQMPGMTINYVKEEDKIKVREQISFELQIRLLKNVNGIYINNENCPNLEAINLDDLPLEKKSTMYWIIYKDQDDRLVSTDKKCWIQDFQIEKDLGSIGKCDFNFKIRTEQLPSTKLNDWLRKDLFIELHTSYPKLQEKKLEDETVVKHVVFEDGQPVIEKKMLGVVRLETSKLVYDNCKPGAAVANVSEEKAQKNNNDAVPDKE